MPLPGWHRWCVRPAKQPFGETDSTARVAPCGHPRDFALGEQLDDPRVLDCAHAVPDPLRAEAFHGVTHAGRASCLPGMHGDMPPGLLTTAKVLLEQLTRPGRLIAGEIQPGELIPMRQ